MTNEEIKTHINERLEALKLELESKFIRVTKEPEFEDGFWYKHKTEDTYGLFEKLGEDNKGICSGEWRHDVIMYKITSWQKVTDFTELETLLKKQAVNLGMVDGAYKLFEDATKRKIEYPLYLTETKILIDDNGLILMDRKGNWSEVVKEKTTEEWLSEVYKSNMSTYDFFKQNNLEITQKK